MTREQILELADVMDAVAETVGGLESSWRKGVSGEQIFWAKSTSRLQAEALRTIAAKI